MAKGDEAKSIKDIKPTHPSRALSARAKGFGIAAGYERPYRKEKTGARGLAASSAGSNASYNGREVYGPLPPAGYYGAGTASSRPFERGQAGFTEELPWY